MAIEWTGNKGGGMPHARRTAGTGGANICTMRACVHACFALLLVLAADLRKGRIRGKSTQLEGDGRSTNDYPGSVKITKT